MSRLAKKTANTLTHVLSNIRNELCRGVAAVEAFPDVLPDAKERLDAIDELVGALLTDAVAARHGEN